MADDISENEPEPEEEAEQSNLERLRSHLKADGLALALLDVWAEDDQEGSKARMRQVVDERFKKSDNDAAD